MFVPSVRVVDPVVRIRRAAAALWSLAVHVPPWKDAAHARVWRVTLAGTGRQLWAKVPRADDPDGEALGREAACLRWLTEQDIAAPEVAGVSGGVLFTRPVHGPSLASRLVAEPHRTAELLTGALTAASHISASTRHLPLTITSVPVPMGIAGEFLRNFSRRQQSPRPLPAMRLHTAVEPLLDYASRPAQTVALAHGDLLPAHVHWPLDGMPTLLSPLLRRAAAGDDTAQLVSRVLLLAATRITNARSRDLIIDGVDRVVRDRARRIRGEYAKHAWWEALIVRWLMDTASHTAACLGTAPSRLTVPERAVVFYAPLLIDFLARGARANFADTRRMPNIWVAVLRRIRELRW